MAKTVLVPTEGGTNPCLISNWAVKEGDVVSLGDMLCEAETDKSVLDILATADGTVLKIIYGDGEIAPVLTPIAIIGTPGEDITDLLPDKTALEKSEQVSNDVYNCNELKEDSIAVSPRAKRYAKEHHIDLTGIKGTGFNNAIIEKNVKDAENACTDYKDLAYELKDEDEYIVYQQTSIERTSASRLFQSMLSSAQSTMSAQADVNNMMSLRRRIMCVGQKYGMPHITINDMILYAVARVLVKHPEINSVWSGEELHRYKHVHLGMAVDTERGLLVPVIRNADMLSLLELSIQTKKLIDAAKSGKLSASQMQGGTFTVSNIGSMGIRMFTPIINPPQTCILGIGTVEESFHWDKNRNVVESSAMTLSLTHDHRAVDGAPAARFLKDLRNFLEDYDVMLIR